MWTMTNEEYAKLQSLSDDDLRGKTQSIQDILNKKLEDIDQQIADLHKEVEENPDMDIHEKEEVFNKIDKLEENRNKQLEDVLMEVLPQAFAVVKETARRFKENEKLVVTANMRDKQLAAKHEHIEIEGDKAIWHNEWLAAGNKTKWEMLHYDVQLIGGVVLHQGKIAEMATGEGKTLVATLPAFLNALSKRGVHIVTVNNYLATRDSEWMGPLFEFHGLSVDCIDKYEPNSEARRAAYGCDIIYGTNNEFGFDYLRDNMSREVDELVQRKHHYAMVDEVDSVLVDEARTPLIISGPIPKGDEHQFHDLKPRIQKLVDAQKRIVSQYLIEAKKLLNDSNEKRVVCHCSVHSVDLPKYKPLIKYLSEPGVKITLPED